MNFGVHIMLVFFLPKSFPHCFKMLFLNAIIFHDLLATNASALVTPMFMLLRFVASQHLNMVELPGTWEDMRKN